jgi:hypothetical protein
MATLESEMEKQRQRNMEDRAGVKVPKEPSKGEIIRSLDTTTNEIAVIASLKGAITDYLQLDDIYKYEDSTSYYCLILGRLEMSLIRRKQSIAEDQKALSELKDG